VRSRLFIFAAACGRQIREWCDLREEVPASINRDGVEYRRLGSDGKPVARNPWGNHRSISLGCHPSQVRDYEEAFAKVGCPTEFDPATGEARITSRRHLRNHLKARNEVFPGTNWVNHDEVRG
jgi:hypothetical protein